MRLRSSQFVFLLLLVCSVQNREQYALHLVAGAVSGPTSNQQLDRQIDAAVSPRNGPPILPSDPPAPQTCLDAASLAAHSTAWSMRRPALDSAAVSSFTGFLRA